MSQLPAVMPHVLVVMVIVTVFYSSCLTKICIGHNQYNLCVCVCVCVYIYVYTVKPLSIVFQGTGKFERYIREMIVPRNH
jgi:hypothetical protein